MQPVDDKEIYCIFARRYENPHKRAKNVRNFDILNSVPEHSPTVYSCRAAGRKNAEKQ